MNLSFKFVLILTTLFCLIATTVKAQNWIWSNQIGSPDFDMAKGTTDKDGNFYTLGSYTGELCPFKFTFPPENSDRHIFLAKYSPEGEQLWLQKTDCDADAAMNQIGAICIDKNNFIYITGNFSSASSSDNDTLTSISPGVFIVKYSPDGSIVWSQQAVSLSLVTGSALAVDDFSNVYITGVNKVTALFDSFSVEPGGFLVKYDSTGVCLLAKKIVPYNSLYDIPDVGFSCMNVFGDNLLIGGSEQATSFTLDTLVIDHPELYGHLLCCYDLTGKLKWKNEGLSQGALSATSLTFDPTGNILITGSFRQSIDFDGSILYTADMYDMNIFLTKYSLSGQVLWAKAMSGSFISAGASVAADHNGNCYLTGEITAPVVFGNDTVCPCSQREMILARFDPDGNCMGTANFGNACGLQVGIDAMDQPVVVGGFTGTITIGDNTFTSYGNDDIFIAKCSAISGIQNKPALSGQMMIYPNPNKGNCTIDLPVELIHEQNLSLNIFDTQGNLVMNKSIEEMNGKNFVKVNLEAGSSGMYYIVLTNGKKNYRGKMVIQ